MRSARDAAPCQVLERIANEGNFRRVTELNQGHVASACSFASMEQVAREQVEAKGVIWERGTHACQFEMEQWVARQEVTRGAFSVEQLFTGSDAAGTTLRSPERAKMLSSMSDALLDVRVQAACQKVVAWLPPALRGPMSCDAKALADILLRLCPESTLAGHPRGGADAQGAQRRRAGGQAPDHQGRFGEREASRGRGRPVASTQAQALRQLLHSRCTAISPVATCPHPQ